MRFIFDTGKLSISMTLAAVLLLGSTHLSAAVSAIDDEGTVIELPVAANRVIALAPSLTELLFAAGAGSKIVGAVEYSDYPDAARAIPIVGRHDLLDMERILELKPDLIVAWQSGNPRASVKRLRELGFAVYIAEPKQLDSIPSHLERLARLTGTESIGNQAAEDFRQQLQILANTYNSDRQ